MNSLLSNVYVLVKYKTEKVSCNQRSNSLFCFIKAQTIIKAHLMDALFMTAQTSNYTKPLVQ